MLQKVTNQAAGSFPSLHPVADTAGESKTRQRQSIHLAGQRTDQRTSEATALRPM